MTFSIAVRDGDFFGVAVASKFLAVGSVVPGVRRGVGAVATQSFARVGYLDELLDALEAGQDPQAALDEATARDEGRAQRQVGVVGLAGAATYTGDDCFDWAGGRTGGDGDSCYAVQGNILTGEPVVAAMEEAWLGSAGQPVQRRLVAALLAGDAAGGDLRGRQSAALVVVGPRGGYDPEAGTVADLRVDDHPDAPRELARISDLWELYFGRPEGVQPLTGELRDEVAGHLATLGLTGEVEQALEIWMGGANLETRATPEGIDARVLEELRREAATPTGTSD
ncbi:DUF1028 domain-containing protein [Nocardioides marmoribigeumensis]|uniref:Ntn-hydrolase superfamily protein n=1 Tax=Nocardioides marmoribigeumensis TaxID=433649 RepID=A0ABU2BTG0_9ACTN|nr:DUF1028 domain-containing protein [Nocardioides marmoribigeumensis]MDR7361927.1 putative Ntn-hydrolase superfamily protein [Nocardioides marmoribigeumensis]